MRRFIYIVILLNISIIFTGCQKDKASPILYKEGPEKPIDIADGEDIHFTIDKISFSKSYQNIVPKVEVIKKGLGHKLLASFGLLDSSGIDIERINKSGNEINIYVSNQSNRRTNQLVVPQAIIDIDSTDINHLENFKFNIHNSNYEPIKIKFDANEAINKINSDYQISTNTLPTIDISKNHNTYYWTLEYYNIFDKVNKDSPIINLTVQIDANSGEVLDSNKEPISSYIDNGYVLDFAPNSYILYKKSLASSKDDPSESLWYYDIKEQSKKKLYNSEDKIISAQFDSDYNNIILLESREKNNQIYLIEFPERKAYKIGFNIPINPSLVKWKDKENLYLIHKEDKNTYIYSYNIKDNSNFLIQQTDKTVLNLEIQKDYLLVLEEDGEDTKICLSKDLKNSLYNDFGYQAKFINESQIAYIKSDPKTDINRLYIYDIEKESLMDSIDFNISNYTIMSKDTLALVEKNPNNKDFTLYEYNLNSKSSEAMVNISSDKIALNLYENTLYVNSTLPFKERETQVIYSVDISKISNSQP